MTVNLLEVPPVSVSSRHSVVVYLYICSRRTKLLTERMGDLTSRTCQSLRATAASILGVRSLGDRDVVRALADRPWLLDDTSEHESPYSHYTPKSSFEYSSPSSPSPLRSRSQRLSFTFPSPRSRLPHTQPSKPRRSLRWLEARPQPLTLTVANLIS